MNLFSVKCLLIGQFAEVALPVVENLLLNTWVLLRI